MKTKYTSILVLLVLISTQISALDFFVEQPLREHLVEVNKEWLNHDLSNTCYNESVRYSSENERIKAHLHAVCNLILNQASAKKEIRQQLIRQLKSYADAGSFPINSRHLNRRPYFIDHRGVPCAVGYLMLNNGFEKEAITVHETMNPAYIREIPSDWLENWMLYSGLSLAELALIQPGYPPSSVWTDLGSEIDGEVTSMVVYENEVYIAGDFTLNGNVFSFAKISGDEVMEVSAVSGIVNDMEVYDGKIWMAGAFFDGSQDLAIWDGENITYSGAYMSKYGQAFDLLNHENQLYVSGFSTGIIGETHSVQRLDGDMWSFLGQFNGPVYSLEYYENRLIAAGDFSAFYNEEWNEVATLRVAAFDEVNWEAMGTGMSSAVRNLENIDGVLWACADLFDLSENPGFGLGTFNPETEIWDSYTDPQTYLISEEPIAGQGFRDIVKTEESLFTCGKFLNTSMMIVGGSIGTFVPFGEIWVYSADTNPFSGTAMDLLLHDEMLYASGDFESVFGDFSELIRSDLSININEQRDPQDDLLIYPNPVDAEILNVMFHAEKGDLIEIYSAEGKLLKSELFDSAMIQAHGQVQIDISTLQSGIYTLVIRNRQNPNQARFIRQ